MRFEIRENLTEDLAPRKLRRAMSRTVNEQAFHARDDMTKVISARMVIRSPGFVRGSVVARKGRLGGKGPWHAWAGSIERKRFTGWLEQETGKKAARPREGTISGARSGSLRKRMRPTARLKPNVEIANKRTMGVRSIPQLIHKTRREKIKRFIVKKNEHHKIPPGLYEHKKGKIHMLQSFGDWKPRRIPWLGMAVGRYLRRVDIGLEFARALRWVGK